MGLVWIAVALCALQALAALAVLPTAEFIREPSTGMSINKLRDDNSGYLETTDDSLVSQVAALQETLEDVAECWGQRRRRRRRRRRPTQAPPSDSDGSSASGDDGGGDSSSRRRRQTPSPQGQMHSSGDGNVAASGQRYMSFGGNAGTDVIGQTLGSIPKLIGQGINAVTEVFGGNAKGGQNGPMGSPSEPSAGTGFFGKISGMSTHTSEGGGGFNSGGNIGASSGGISSWFPGGNNNRNQDMGRPNGPVGGPNMQGQGTDFSGKIPGMATHKIGRGGGSSSESSTGTGSGGIFSWVSGGNNRNPGMGRPNGPVGGPNMQSHGNDFLGKIPGMATHMMGGGGGSSSGSSTGTGSGGIFSWFSGGNNRNPGMGDHNRPDGGRPGRSEMGGGGGINIQTAQSTSFHEEIPRGGVFSEKDGREETGGRPSMSLSRTTQGVGEGNGGLRTRGGPQGHVGHSGIQEDGHSQGRGNDQGGEGSVSFDARMKPRGMAPRTMGESPRGAENMEPRGTVPPANMDRHSRGQTPQTEVDRRSRGAGPKESPNMGEHSRGAGDMEHRGNTPPANMETGGSAETTAGGQGNYSRPSSRRHKRAAGYQSDTGRSQHILNGSNSKESDSFETTCRTESQGGREILREEVDRKRKVCSGRSKRAVPGRSSSTSTSENRGRGASRSDRSRTRSQERSRNRSGRGRSRTGGSGVTGRRAAASSSSAASSGASVQGRGKRTYSFSSSSMSSDGRGTFQSGGGVIGRAPSVQTVRKTRVKRQIDVGSAVSAAGLAAQASLTIANQVLGLVRQSVVVAAEAANTAIDVAQRVRSPAPRRRFVIRIYQSRRRG